MTEAEDRAIALNFSWVEDGLVAGCRGPRTDQDLAWLADFFIRALVRLAPEDESGLRGSQVEHYAMRDCYEPVTDFTPPSQQQLDRVIAFMMSAKRSSDPVAVSCGAGCGRTGTVLACYLIAEEGLAPSAAIEKLVAIRPCSQEVLRVPGHKDAVLDFYRRMKNLDRNREAL